MSRSQPGARQIEMTPRIARALIELRHRSRADFDALPPAVKLAVAEVEAEERRRAMLVAGDEADSKQPAVGK